MNFLFYSNQIRPFFPSNSLFSNTEQAKTHYHYNMGEYGLSFGRPVRKPGLASCIGLILKKLCITWTD